MNPYSLSVLIFAIGSFLIGVQILVRRRDEAGVVYFFLSLLYCVWGVGYSLCTSGNLSYDNSLFVIRVSNAGAAFIPIAWLHFCLIYTRRMEPSVRVYGLMYIAPCIVLLGLFSRHFLPALQSIPEFKYYPVPGILCNLHMSIYFVVTPLGFYQLWRSIQNLSGDEKKRQTYFLIVSFLGYLGGALSFFPVYGILVPQIGLFLLPLYPFGKAYFMGSSGLLFDEERIAQVAHKDKLAALGILTASINHEIRGPLFVMRGAIETESNVEQIRNKALPQIDRITGIVSRLMHFAKKGVEEAAQIEALDLKEVLTDIRPLFQHQLNYQSIQYSQEIPADLPTVMADRRYLEEILFNLILNACQALREIKSPKITLSASLSSPSSRGSSHSSSVPASPAGRVIPSTLVISIVDNGPGFTDKQLKNVFKPFHTTKEEGTGLGLYITKQLVEKCGGKIEIKSVSGKGAQFILRFKS